MNLPHLELKSELMLSAALRVAKPLVAALVREGVPHGVFTRELKSLFVQAASGLLHEQGAKVTDSAVSLLSGVHRKDLRQMAQSKLDEADSASAGRPVSALAEVFTRWITEPSTCNAKGQPLPLPRTGPAPSFEALALSVTKDVHPASLLDSLMRMGLVVDTPQGLLPAKGGFVPEGNVRELLALFAGNTGDHLAAATANLASDKPQFLEHSVFADELAPESVQLLHQQAVSLWTDAYKQFVASAVKRCEADAEQPNLAHQRLRFGVYFYAAPMEGAQSSGDPSHE